MFDYYADHEKSFAENFISKKHVICLAEEASLLSKIRSSIAQIAAKHAGIAAPSESEEASFLNTFHHHVKPNELNDIRLHIISDMNQITWFRQAYFNLGKNTLFNLVGNELAMQRRVNLSIQFPNDDSSILPVHADVWSGDSPYEIVMWLPLVDCHDSKSMFFTHAQFDEEVQENFSVFKNKSTEDLYQAIQEKVEFLNVPYGSALFFSQNVMHGNRINRTDETRWSMNCRFKHILTPYCGKKLGTFFDPIIVRPATHLGLNYKLPAGLHE
ncbi:MAG: hypothetical protein NXI01_03830 [Gammaproteobacteria bacterium]|nr:hypothetical protein [Gammaproteobacteria bacterium]